MIMQTRQKAVCSIASNARMVIATLEVSVPLAVNPAAPPAGGLTTTPDTVAAMSPNPPLNISIGTSRARRRRAVEAAGAVAGAVEVAQWLMAGRV